MVAVITAVLAGSTAAIAASLILDHSLAAAIIAGTLVAAARGLRDDPAPELDLERASVEPLGTQGVQTSRPHVR